MFEVDEYFLKFPKTVQGDELVGKMVNYYENLP